MSAWELADRLATERGMEPPSDRRFLVERVAWGIHYAAFGYTSPRAIWAEMSDDRRAELFLVARGAISAYEAQLAAATSELRLSDPHTCRFEASLREVVDGTWDAALGYDHGPTEEEVDATA